MALAFKHFAEEQVDIAVVETGLGGGWTHNVLKPELSIITNIGLDHQQFLGDTIQNRRRESWYHRNRCRLSLGETRLKPFNFRTEIG